MQMVDGKEFRFILCKMEYPSQNEALLRCSEPENSFDRGFQAQTDLAGMTKDGFFWQQCPFSIFYPPSSILRFRFALDSPPSATALGGSSGMRPLTVPPYLTAADYTIDSNFCAKKTGINLAQIHLGSSLFSLE
jgi:hypothetical protein